MENSEDYMNSLNRSLSLAMDEFYGYYCTSVATEIYSIIINIRIIINIIPSPLNSTNGTNLSNRTIKATGVSAATGEGVEGLFAHIDDAAVEFKELYLPDLLR